MVDATIPFRDLFPRPLRTTPARCALPLRTPPGAPAHSARSFSRGHAFPESFWWLSALVVADRLESPSEAESRRVVPFESANVGRCPRHAVSAALVRIEGESVVSMLDGGAVAAQRVRQRDAAVVVE